MNYNEIQSQAKKLLDKFAEALGSVDSEALIGVDREIFEREEREGFCEEDFKKNFLDNAPKKSNEHILVEKGSWK